MAFRDGFGREIDYLRISVTDRCNLRCRYCMPAEGVVALRHDDILRYEEIERLARAAAELGIRKIRLTGGEPLVRRGIVDLVAALAAIPGIRDLSMTTNGTLLAPMAVSLAQAGLNRVNVSLDTLDARAMPTYTRGGSLEAALAGIAAAEAGRRPLKSNAGATRGFNADELAALAALTLEHDWHVRFIELLPLNDGAVAFEVGYIPADEIRAVLRAAYGELIPVATADQPAWNGPAEYVRLPGGRGMVGIITPGERPLLRPLQPPAPDGRRQAAHVPLFRPGDRRACRPAERREPRGAAGSAAPGRGGQAAGHHWPLTSSPRPRHVTDRRVGAMALTHVDATGRARMVDVERQGGHCASGGGPGTP
jgi:cyclic pyranopterin phosphate synthase